MARLRFEILPNKDQTFELNNLFIIYPFAGPRIRKYHRARYIGY